MYPAFDTPRNPTAMDADIIRAGVEQKRHPDGKSHVTPEAVVTIRSRTSCPQQQQQQQQQEQKEAGNEKTGRWTKEEHEAFLSGLKIHGEDWKKVAEHVSTRTVVETRTHAQKFFQKLKYFQKLSKGEVR
jgi:SHAQKYF class myb-like DNA-binding protein